MNLEKLELLSPAGDLEKLETAGVYGADAAYIGLNGLSLRAPQQLFTGDYLKKAIEIKKKYNIFSRILIYYIKKQIRTTYLLRSSSDMFCL